MSASTAYIGLGSNVGDRELYLKGALEMMDGHEDIAVISCSSIYETEPYGPVKQDDFLNMVAKVKTPLPPIQLLRELQGIEVSLQRKRDIHWGPRTIDLDILLYNHENIVMEDLKIPHPEIPKRLFVVKPLLEVEPTLVLPDTTQALTTLYDSFKDGEGVHLWRGNNGERRFGLFES